MPYDPELIAETRSWLERAASDLQAASVLLQAHPPLMRASVFHCQQAVEKSFKGFLTWHSTPFRKTHHLEEIGDQCLRIDPSLQPSVVEAVPLTKYAWKFHYPGEPKEPSREEAQAPLAIAHRTYENILARLPHEVRP